MKVYIASKTKHASTWQLLKSSGIPFVCSWIDEAEMDKSTSLSDLACRCIAEATGGDLLVLYLEPGEQSPGAWIECGAALAAQKPVIVVGDASNVGRVFLEHPLVTHVEELCDAIELIRDQSNFARCNCHE